MCVEGFPDAVIEDVRFTECKSSGIEAAEGNAWGGLGIIQVREHHSGEER
jgi:hypothetical protein